MRARAAMHRSTARALPHRAGAARYRTASGRRRRNETEHHPRQSQGQTAPRPPGAAHPARSPHARCDVSHVTCIELIAFLDSYVDNELDAETRNSFDLHLLVCPSCRAYLASYRETIELVRGAAEREEELAHDAPAELIEAVKKVKR